MVIWFLKKTILYGFLKQPYLWYKYTMARKDFSKVDCSVARCLDAVGDIWAFLIVRDAMFGITRYSDFQRSLGIAKNILRDRLEALVEQEILRKVDAGEHGPRFEYKLTEKGRDLFPVMVALRQWSDKWVEPEARNILIMTDRAKQQPLPYMRVLDGEGNPLTLHDIRAELPEP